MRTKTYDFRAFCRGELVRTDTPWYDALLAHLSPPAPYVVPLYMGIPFAHPLPFPSVTWDDTSDDPSVNAASQSAVAK
ncbi:MAG: hypothetical protein K6T83_12460 [Alicyclobacillus sp.]|nr:hypothetical protein [Alicyclobacillus sp.]